METTTEDPTAEDKPANVVAALAAVMGELPGIGKDMRAAEGQGGYAYRGIEQITQHVQPLLAKYGVLFVPRVVSHEIRDIIVAGKPWTDTIERIEYTVYGPGGADDRITVGPILAIGRDNSDKGANKCMTQAFKYALLQSLCISDAKDDADGSTHEADGRPDGGRHAAPDIEPADPVSVEALRNRMNTVSAGTPGAKQALIDAWALAKLPKVGDLKASQVKNADAVVSLIEGRAAAGQFEAGPLSGPETTGGTDSPPAPAEGAEAPNPAPMAEALTRRLHLLLRKKRNASGDSRFPVLTEILGRPVTSSKQLTQDEGIRVCEVLDAMADYVPLAAPPPGDDNPDGGDPIEDNQDDALGELIVEVLDLTPIQVQAQLMEHHETPDGDEDHQRRRLVELRAADCGIGADRVAAFYAEAGADS